MENIWFVAALWMALAFGASLISIWTGISVALIEILVGVTAGTFFSLHATLDWINFLAMLGSGVLTFLAGAEIDPQSLRANLRASLLIGVISFSAPFALVWVFAVKVDPKRSKEELVAVPTLCDLLHTAGLRTAAINWPCTRDSNSVDDDFPDVPETLAHTTPRLRQELVAENILPNETDASFRAMTGPGRDEVWTKAACRVIRARQPHLLLPEQFAVPGLPSPEKNPGMADLILISRDGFAVSRTVIGNEFVAPVTGTMNQGYHGYLASNPKG